MVQESQPNRDVASPGTIWNVGSAQLTEKGEAELLRFFGSKLEECYEQLIVEPLPDHIQFQLARLATLPPIQEAEI